MKTLIWLNHFSIQRSVLNTHIWILLLMGIHKEILVTANPEPSAPLFQKVSSWPGSPRGSVLGVALHQKTAYLAMGESGMLIVDVQNPAHPVMIDHIFHGQHVSKVRCLNGHLYVATQHHRGSKFESDFYQRGTLHVLNLNNPHHPVEVSSLSLGSQLLGMSFEDHFLLIGEGGGQGYNQTTVRRIDISDPANPVLFKMTQINAGPELRFPLAPLSIKNVGDQIFAASSARIGIHEWKSTGAIEFLTDLRISMTGRIQAWQTENHLTYEVRHDVDRYDWNNPVSRSTFIVWDTKDPSKVARLASLDFKQIPPGEENQIPNIVINRLEGMVISKGFAFVCLGWNGVHVFDVRDPMQPVHLTNIDTPGIARQIHISDGLAYVADSHGGLQIIDVNDPSQMKIVGQFETGLTPRLFNIDDQKGILVSSYDFDDRPTFEFIDLSSPATPKFLGSYPVPHPLKEFQFKDDKLFLIWNEEDDAEFIILDVSDPKSILEISKTRLIDPRKSARYSEILLHPSLHYVYITKQTTDPLTGYPHYKLLSIDITDLSQPKVLHEIKTKGKPVEHGIDLVGSQIFLNTFSNRSPDRLEIFDIGDGSSLSPVTTMTLPVNQYAIAGNNTGGLDISSGHAFLGQGWKGFSVVDVKDPSNPIFRSNLNTDGKVNDLQVYGDYIFTVEESNGLNVYDISLPDSPMQIEHIPTKVEASSFQISGEHVYLLEKGYGLSVFKIPSTEIHITRHPQSTHIASGDTATLHVGAFGSKELSYQWYVGESGDTNQSLSDENTSTLTTGPIRQQQRYWVRVMDDQVSADSHTATISPIPSVKVELMGRWPEDPSQFKRDGFSTDVAVSGPYIYLADGLDGVRILKANNLATPTVIGNYPSAANQLSILGDHLYTNGNTVQKLNINNPFSPAREERFQIYDEVLLPLNENLSILGGKGGWQTLNFKDPTNEIELIKSDVLSRASEWAIKGITIRRNYAAVAQGWGGIQVLDIQQATTPSFITAYYPNASIHDLAWKDDWILATHGNAYPGLELVNMKDPHHPTLAASIDLPHANNVALMDDSYACVTGEGLQIFDYGDPSQLIQVGTADETEADTFGLEIHGNLVYVAAGDDGLFIYRITPELTLNPPVVEGDQLRITWLRAPGVVLQETSNLDEANWRDVQDSEDRGEVLMPLHQARNWYRLIKR